MTEQERLPEAPIIEIFSSLQGEGPYVGERHLFVRFQDCEFTCKFCDTPLSFVENKFCRVECPPFSKKFRSYPNPVSRTVLDEILQDFTDETLVLTGGEPLQKAGFLREWLAEASQNPHLKKRKVLLETAGIHVAELQEVIEWVDIISMDLKLPSVTGMHPWWREHEAFLKIARSQEVYVKVVVSGETKEDEVARAASLVAAVDRSIPLILQPVTPFGSCRSAPSPEQLSGWHDLARTTLDHVRVISQMHRSMGIL